MSTKSLSAALYELRDAGILHASLANNLAIRAEALKAERDALRAAVERVRAWRKNPYTRGKRDDIIVDWTAFDLALDPIPDTIRALDAALGGDDG